MMTYTGYTPRQVPRLMARWDDLNADAVDAFLYGGSGPVPVPEPSEAPGGMPPGMPPPPLLPPLDPPPEVQTPVQEPPAHIPPMR